LQITQNPSGRHLMRRPTFPLLNTRALFGMFLAFGQHCGDSLASHVIGRLHQGQQQYDPFRFASTGPCYVEIGQQPRISKASAQFFYDWVYERARRIQIDDAKHREDVLAHHHSARDFWQDLVDRANAE
jgi:hypothetical protein